MARWWTGKRSWWSSRILSPCISRRRITPSSPKSGQSVLSGRTVLTDLCVWNNFWCKCNYLRIVQYIMNPFVIVYHKVKRDLKKELFCAGFKQFGNSWCPTKTYIRNSLLKLLLQIFFFSFENMFISVSYLQTDKCAVGRCKWERHWWISHLCGTVPVSPWIRGHFLRGLHDGILPLAPLPVPGAVLPVPVLRARGRVWPQHGCLSGEETLILACSLKFCTTHCW